VLVETDALWRRAASMALPPQWHAIAGLLGAAPPTGNCWWKLPVDRLHSLEGASVLRPLWMHDTLHVNGADAYQDLGGPSPTSGMRTLPSEFAVTVARGQRRQLRRASTY
jgi:hypothetical protein